MPKKYIDITFKINEGMTTFPVYWHPVVEITKLGRLGIEKRETRKLILGTHTGTHVDAPRHFIVNGETIDQIPLDVLIGPALVLNLSHFPRFYEISAEEMQGFLKGRQPKRLVLRYDWSDHIDTDYYYTDHPFLSEAAAKYLVDQGVKLLAMDTPMPDNPKNGKGTANDSPNHKIILGSGVLLVEYLCDLKMITKEEIELIVAPLKIEGGDGSPARCIAVIED